MVVLIKKPYRCDNKMKNIANRKSEKKKLGVVAVLKFIKKWVYKEMKSPENLPNEFKEYFLIIQQDHFKYRWHRYL